MEFTSTSIVVALAASTGLGFLLWRIVQRNRMQQLWEEVSRRLHLRLVSHGRGAVYELIGEVRGAPVSARLIPESTRNPVTIFVGRRAMARQTGEELVADDDPMIVYKGDFKAQIDAHGLIADLSKLPGDAAVGVQWVQNAVELYLNHYQKPFERR
jgi:hypothetical protein